MNVSSIVKDERLKMVLPQACSYCGCRESLSIDHVLPTSRGGPDSSDNVVWACKSCNSSKGATDLLVWLKPRVGFPPLLLLRRYLKLAIEYSRRVGFWMSHWTTRGKRGTNFHFVCQPSLRNSLPQGSCGFGPCP